jgi:CheY-like chemotaxis protein
LRILLAEDNAMNQKVALRLLERLGYRADVATNGLEAIEALERQPYDVVLMDVQMPELDGLDATRRIGERWPAETRPHIIAMTANALPEDREACFAAGMNDYVAKPIRAEELAAALKRARPLGNGDVGPTAVDHVSLDDRALKNLRDLGGDDFLGEVIDAFLADAPELMATLRRSLDEQSAEELRRAAHTLKSNGATLGAEQFAERCPRASSTAPRPASSTAPRGSWTDRAGVPPLAHALFGPSLGIPRVSASASAPGTILIADDNRVNRPPARARLEGEGHSVAFGRARRRSARAPARPALRPDAARRPDARARRLRRAGGAAARPALRDIPVIVTSALDELDSVVRCLEMGAEDYLAKPVNPVLLNARSTRASRKSACATSSAS